MGRRLTELELWDGGPQVRIGRRDSVVAMAMDSGGKDGVIKHVLKGC